MKSAVVRAFGLLASVLVAGVAGAQSTQAVEWKVSEGGNGHWYQCFRSTTTGDSWLPAKSDAELRGGHLATITSAAENSWVYALTVSQNAWNGRGGPLLGARKNPSNSFYWITGEPFNYTNWLPGEPSSGLWEPYLMFLGPQYSSQSGPTWNDTDGLNSPGYFYTYVVEWEADCNGDGIVDYGQIQSGQLDDDNNDGIPDTCQYTVTGVIPVSGASSGGTAITVKGSNFPENPTVFVGGSPATNVIRVSATRLTAVTPAGLPGMTSVTVGNWVQPNAFYYRPECGSDLDQNGVVDGGDLAILLLDFGPCYSNAANTQPEDSTPFLLQDQPAPVAPRSR